MRPDGDLHQVWNLVPACYACNSAKRDRPPAADWMPWLARRHTTATEMIPPWNPPVGTISR